MSVTAHVDKLLLVNRGALEAKYGDAGVKAVLQALDDLVDADRGRGIVDTVVAIDDAAALAAYGLAPVAVALDQAQVKGVVDGLYRVLTPDYLVLVGAPDVIPHQDLDNPMAGDGDPVVPADLPYACEHGYSTDPADFISPTRVVGRIPDLVAGTDPEYLVGVLRCAAEWAPFPANHRGGFAFTAQVWRGSTDLSAGNLFGPGADVRSSPADGPQWEPALLQRPFHFINCHGAPADSHFYGQHGNHYPVAHDAAYLAANASAGTVVAAECCYGAELYDPSLANGVAGICNTYLQNGAYGFCGSSTIAYGPADGNANADLLTQYFLKDVMGGASLGRALLQARQDFLRNANIVDPADLKTLAQFHLLGDPSIQTVDQPGASPGMAGVAASEAKAMHGATRSLRRRHLYVSGLSLADSTSVAQATDRQPDSATVGRLLALAGAAPATAVSAKTFDVASPAMASRSKAFGASLAAAPASAQLFLVVGAPASDGSPAGRRIDVETLAQTFAVVALELEGEVVSWRRLDAR